MSILLPPELLEFVNTEVALGKYPSEADVVCAGLRLLREREKRLASLRADIQIGLDQLDRGEGRTLDAEEVKARGHERFAKRHESK
jgi:antitoxin ParD1/3/4